MTVNRVCKVPERVEDVTPAWLKEVLQESAATEDVEVVSLKAITNPGGHLSMAFKASVTFNGGPLQHLFIKKNLPSDDPYKTYTEANGLDTNEIKAYKANIPMLVQFESSKLGYSELAACVPKFYAGECTYDETDAKGFFLILEDLTFDYRMANITDGLTFAQFTVAFEQMARFHAVSYAFRLQTKVDFSGPDFKPALQKMVEGHYMDLAEHKHFPMAIEDLKSSEDTKEFVKPMEDLLKVCRRSFADNIFHHAGDHQFLSHGDYWSNNVMFSLDGRGCKIVDWQFLCTAQPYVDFILMLLCSVKPSSSAKWLEPLAKVYHEAFSRGCADFGLDVPFTLDSFIHDCKTKGYFNFLIRIMFIYDPVGRKPSMRERFLAMIENSYMYSPEYFQ